MLTRTTTALLEGLVDPANEEVWREFDARYRPILVAFSRRLGLSAEDAADAAQETLTRFVQAYRAGRYDRRKGRLHSWIIGIAKHCINDLFQARIARREQRGLSAMVDLPGAEQLNEIWEAECREVILQQGLAVLRAETNTEPKTLRAFEMVAFHQRSPSEVASETGMTLNDVYLAKHRCLKRLRTILSGLNEVYELC